MKVAVKLCSLQSFALYDMDQLQNIITFKDLYIHALASSSSASGQDLERNDWKISVKVGFYTLSLLLAFYMVYICVGDDVRKVE
mgnify:FL=1